LILLRYQNSQFQHERLKHPSTECSKPKSYEDPTLIPFVRKKLNNNPKAVDAEA